MDSIQSDLDTAYIIGALRDGCFTRNEKYYVYRVRIYQKNKEWLEKISDKFHQTFGKMPTIKHDSRDNVWCLVLDSKDIFQKLVKLSEFPGNQKTWKTPRFVLEAPKEIKKAYICGFFDAEGGVPHIEKKEQEQKNIRIYFSQVSQEALIELKSLIEGFDIKCGKVSGPYFKKGFKHPTYGLRIHGISEVAKFSTLIGSLHHEKILRLKTIEELNRCLHKTPEPVWSISARGVSV